MIVIPLVVSESEMDIAIVLEDDNIRRMKEHDPAEVVRSQMSVWADHAIRNVMVFYASPEDMTTVQQLMQGESVGAALRFLARGFKYRPDQGDTDEQYDVRTGKKIEETPGPMFDLCAVCGVPAKQCDCMPTPAPARQHRPRSTRKNG